MMPKRKKKKIIIASIIVFILLIIAIFVVIYIKTDVFKSNSTLFTKYLAQNFSQIKEMNISQNSINEIEDLLQKSKYISNIEGTVSYSDKQNKINDIKLNVNSQTDNQEKYAYKNIKISNTEKTILGLEYLNNDNEPSIRLKGIKQFVAMDYDDMAEINETLRNIDINEVEFKKSIKGLFEFSQEEENTLKNRYMSIIEGNLSSGNYAKQPQAIITINGQQLKTNAYSIKLPKEKMNELYIKILEELKKDEIILNKIDNIETKLVENGIFIEKLKNEFIEKIETKIEEIKNNNIGQDEKKITVYESDEKTVRTAIETNDGTLNIDFIMNDNDKFVEFKDTKNNEKENSIDIKIGRKLEKMSDNINISINRIQDDETRNIEMNIKESLEDNDLANDIILKMYNDNNEVIINVKNKINIVEEFVSSRQISNDDRIDLYTLDREQIKNIKETLKNNFNRQMEELETNLSSNDINRILIEIGFAEEGVEPINENLTETEVNRFNANFEFYEGTEISKDTVEQLIDVAKEHMDSVKITKYKEKRRETDPKEPKEYRIIIKKDNKNEKLANKLVEYIEKEKKDKYTIKIDHDDDTGLVNNIWITLNE